MRSCGGTKRTRHRFNEKLEIKKNDNVVQEDKWGLEEEAGCAYRIKYKVQSTKYKVIILQAKQVLSYPEKS